MGVQGEADDFARGGFGIRECAELVAEVGEDRLLVQALRVIHRGGDTGGLELRG